MLYDTVFNKQKRQSSFPILMRVWGGGGGGGGSVVKKIGFLT